MNRGKDSFEMVWRCPKCGRVFREHVFEAATGEGGPICNHCAVELVWVAAEKDRSAAAKNERLSMDLPIG